MVVIMTVRPHFLGTRGQEALGSSNEESLHYSHLRGHYGV